MSPIRPPVSASKISVPDTDVGDRFDDWVRGWQFGPFQPHHPVLRNRKSRRRVPIGRFCGDFRRYRSTLSVSGGPLRSHRPIFSLQSLHPKIPFPAAGFLTAHALRLPGIGGMGGQKATFRTRSVIIADSIQGLRTAGSILREHREVARLRCRVAIDLRPRCARGLVRGTRAISSC